MNLCSLITHPIASPRHSHHVQLRTPSRPCRTNTQPAIRIRIFHLPEQRQGTGQYLNNSEKNKAYVASRRLGYDFENTHFWITSGSTEGTVDGYFIAPSGQRLRSKNEVLTFLETGSKRKKPPTQSSDDTATLEGSATRSKKKTSARKKFHASFKFDLKNPPDKVSWFLSYASEDVWSPSVGDRNLPLATKQEWAAVLNHVCQN